MQIGIVTSFYNGYEIFLIQWAKSICKLKRKPDFVNICQSGTADEKIVKKAILLLDKCEIKNNFIKIPKHKGMGYARNKAVNFCITEWVMYLDVDDVIMKNALDNLEQYAMKCDVICGGLLIKNLNGTIKEKYFLHANRKKVLIGKWCCCSHAIYKKKFWKKSQYIENNDFVDYPLWLGFAQKGAIFLGINQLLTVYLKRKEGHHLSMTKKDFNKAKIQKNKFIKYGVNSKCLKKK